MVSIMSEKRNFQHLSEDSRESKFSAENSFLLLVQSTPPRQSSSDDIVMLEKEDDTQDSCSDSSSVIFLDEFTRFNNPASPQKKIKLEGEKEVNNADLPCDVLPNVELDGSSSVESEPEIEFSQNNSSSAVNLTLEKKEKDEDVNVPINVTPYINHDAGNSLNIGLGMKFQSNSSSPSTVPGCINKDVLDDTTNESCASRFMSVKRLTRDDLEMIIMKQMITVITANERIADLEEKLESSEKMLQLFRDKSSKLTREVTTLDLVLKRFLLQVQNGHAKIVRPPKRTMRSVGIQVRQEAIVNGASKKQAGSKACKINPPACLDTSKGKTISNALNNQQVMASASRDVHPNVKPDCSQSLSNSASKSAEQNLTIEADSTNEDNELEIIPEPYPPLPEASEGSITADPSWKPPPPKLELQISKVAHSLHFCWNTQSSMHEEVQVYRIWGYSKSSHPSQKWEQLAEFPSDRLPMSCRIDATKLVEQCKTSELCYFIIRASDVYGRDGPWSDPASVRFP